MTATRTVWTPAPLLLPTEFPPSCTIEIHAAEGGRTLVGAIELVSSGNKDRLEKRRLLASKCATYLSRGIGLVLIDVVTSRQANIHNDMIDLIGWDRRFAMASATHVYAVAYRPLQDDGVGRIECWPVPLVVGQLLPRMPLSLAADLCLALDLESTYQSACDRRRFDEVVG